MGGPFFNKTVTQTLGLSLLTRMNHQKTGVSLPEHMIMLQEEVFPKRKQEQTIGRPAERI